MIARDSNILIFGPAKCGKTKMTKELADRTKTVVFTHQVDEWNDTNVEAVVPGEYSDQALRAVPIEDRDGDIQIIVDGATGDEGKSFMLSGVSQASGCSVVVTVDAIDKFHKLTRGHIPFDMIALFRHADAGVILDKFSVDPTRGEYNKLADRTYMLIKLIKK